jgi:hypothetical protein
MPAHLPNEPKRNSGRTGRRRLSPAELALREPKAAIDHRRRYGTATAPVLSSPLHDPPAWFTPSLTEIWHNTIAAAAPGALAAIDCHNLAVYCVAVETHRRLAQRLIGEGDPSVELERRVRLAGVELGRSAKALALLPVDRSKIPVTPPVEPDEFAQFDTILPDGSRVPSGIVSLRKVQTN